MRFCLGFCLGFCLNMAANGRRAEQVLFQNLALTKSVGSMGSARLLSAVQQRSQPDLLFCIYFFQLICLTWLSPLSPMFLNFNS